MQTFWFTQTSLHAIAKMAIFRWLYWHISNVLYQTIDASCLLTKDIFRITLLNYYTCLCHSFVLYEFTWWARIIPSKVSIKRLWCNNALFLVKHKFFNIFWGGSGKLSGKLQFATGPCQIYEVDIANLLSRLLSICQNAISWARTFQPSPISSLIEFFYLR